MHRCLRVWFKKICIQKKTLFFSMSSLENKSIAAVRKSMLRGSLADLLIRWNEAEKKIKGGNEHDTFEHMLKRDVVAYTIVKFVDMMDGYVFGGFVASHFSGLPWTDLDIVMKDTSFTMMSHMITFICFVFSFKKYEVRAPPRCTKVMGLMSCCETVCARIA